ncbi:MAG TPA: DUF1365 domain-containing protein [Gemmatales bacterium]|nr:DUF1365 domain-containing protein [Gemmatales bacterium]
MHSCIYHGYVEHTRLHPLRHQFRYSAFMMYLDLAELDQVFRDAWFWSTRRPTVAWFRRRDHLGDPHEPLDEAVRDLVEQQIGTRPAGPIRLLTNLRYFGYVMNPVSYYYCFDELENLQAVVAEIHNTPWGERHCYVITPRNSQSSDGVIRFDHQKAFHVSPFMPMDLQYHWQFKTPGPELDVKISLSREQRHIFHAELTLTRLPFTRWNRTRTLVRFPFMTAKIIAAIYWQAFRLRLKKFPYYAHPNAR